MVTRPPITPHKGFTLVEAVVAVAILGVLAVLLSSVLGIAQRKAADSKCIYQLKQLGVAGLQFAAENGGRLPYRGDWAHPTNGKTSILPYLGIPLRQSGEPEKLYATVLTCPAAQRGKTPAQTEFFRTYGINQYATGNEAGSESIVTTWLNHVATRNSPRLISQVKHPAQQAFFMDGSGMLDSTNYSKPTFRYSAYQTPDRLEPLAEGSSGWRTPYVHEGRIHVVYLDGHVGPLSLKEAQNGIIGPTNSAGTTRKHLFWGAEL